MYVKIILCHLILLVIARSEEISTVKNMETADLLNSRLSTLPSYPSLYNDEHLVKDNPKRTLVLLMPVSQTPNEHEKSNEAIQKTKRCDTQRRKNRFLLSTKGDNNRARTGNKKNFNVGISKQNSDDYIIRDPKHSQKNSATLKRMVGESYEDKTLLQALKNKLNAEDVIINLKSQEKAKKCNAKKYICHCEEENCFSSSSKKSSSRMLGSSRIDEPERTNQRRKYENAKPDILQQQSPQLYHENPYELPLPPNLINYFSIQSYPEEIENIPPVLYGIIPNVSPYMVGNERKYVDVEIPFTSLQGRQNYLVGNNRNQPIIRNKPCSPINDRVKSSTSVTSPSTNDDDATTIKEITNDLVSNNPISNIKKVEEYVPKLITEIPNVDALADSETGTNLRYSLDVTEETNTVGSYNLNKIVHESKDFTEHAERNPDDFSKVTTYSADYVDVSKAPSVTFDEINDGRRINMEECIQLFGRDVCVLSATSPRMLAKQLQINNPDKYSTIRIPEYVTQMSTRKKTTLNNVNYSDKIKTTDPYFASESSTNGINKSNVNEYPEFNSKSNSDVDQASLRESQYPESIEKISEPDINHDKNKSLSIEKNTNIPIKKLMDPTIDEIAKTERNKSLGKSKSDTTKLLLNPNDEEIANSTLSDNFLSSTSLNKSSSDEETKNLKINQQNQITNTNSNKEDTTIINCAFADDSKEQNKNYLKESNVNTDYKKKIPQEHFKEETTTSSDFKIGYTLSEETKKETVGIEANTTPAEIPQEQSTTMHYFNDKKLGNLNNAKDTTNNLKTIIDSSTRELPFCDNTLLLNSIRKVINDFALDARLSKTKDFDENILQTQGKNLLPEILQVPNLSHILSMPQIEETIVEKVKDVLSYVTAIPKKDFTNDWSHGVIKNTLHSILNGFSGFHQKLPPMTVEEHQFKNGEWKTNLVTLAPILDQKLSIAKSENLRESIKEFLSSPAIASQIDQDIVRNIIVESVKNRLTKDKDDKIDDSIIHALNDALQTLKNSEDNNALEKSDGVISDEEDMDIIYMQEMPTSNYEINSTLNSKQNLDIKKDTTMDNKIIQTIDTDYQKVKLLENVSIPTTSEFPYLLQLHEEKEEETTTESKIKEDTKDQILNKIKKTDVQDDAEKKVAESRQPKMIYHKTKLQNNPSVEQDETFDKKSRFIKKPTTIANVMQETLPKYAQVSDDKNVVGTNPLIILEKMKFNLPPTKYYSSKNLKYTTNRIDVKNIESTTASTNFMQETSSNCAQDGTIFENIASTKDGNKMEYPLTTTANNLISSANVEYRDYAPKIISLTDNNFLESQQQNFAEDNIVKIHEVTTEMQRTYAKTTYFKASPSSGDSPRISSPTLTCGVTDINTNNENNNDNNNNNLMNNAMKAKKVIVSSSKSSVSDDIDPSQLFPSSITSDDISELQRSQLYYISDDVKLPLEIKRLEDGSYALLISKNVCEHILTRCPCCVPLQGNIIQILKNHQQEDMQAMTTTTEKKDQENVYVNNIKRDYQSDQPFHTTLMITRRNALKTQNSTEEEEKERISANYLWEKNNNLANISMPVIDFAKKYNLLLDFNKERILNGTESQNKTQYINKSVMKSVEDIKHQSEERNLNNYHDIKKNRLSDENNDAIDKIQDLINVREKKNTPNINFPVFPITQKFDNLGKNSRELEVRNINAKVKITKDLQNMNIEDGYSRNPEKINPTLKEINISEESKIDKEETKWRKLSHIAEGNTKVFHKNENREHEAMESFDNDYKSSKVTNFRGNIEKSYRNQRNTNNVSNQRTELVKSMLHWIKGLFVDK